MLNAPFASLLHGKSVAQSRRPVTGGWREAFQLPQFADHLHLASAQHGHAVLAVASAARQSLENTQSSGTGNDANMPTAETQVAVRSLRLTARVSLPSEPSEPFAHRVPGAFTREIPHIVRTLNFEINPFHGS